VYLSNQIVRSAISPALNYGEAQAGESKKDFIHKMKICLKELRETYLSLKIIKRTGLSSNVELIEKALDERNQLVSIFVKSVETASRNQTS
jgi:four helix bundle protein